MNEDTTKNLSGSSSFEERVLAEFAAQREFNAQLLAMVQQLNTRLTALEEKVDARLHDTRPIWEGVQVQLTEVQLGIKELNRQFKTLIQDSFNLRARVDDLEDRLPLA